MVQVLRTPNILVHLLYSSTISVYCWLCRAVFYSNLYICIICTFVIAVIVFLTYNRADKTVSNEGFMKSVWMWKCKVWFQQLVSSFSSQVYDWKIRFKKRNWQRLRWYHFICKTGGGRKRKKKFYVIYLLHFLIFFNCFCHFVIGFVGKIHKKERKKRKTSVFCLKITR